MPFASELASIIRSQLPLPNDLGLGKKIARRVSVFPDTSLALASRFARQPKHHGVVRDRKDRKDRNGSRWSPHHSDPSDLLRSAIVPMSH